MQLSVEFSQDKQETWHRGQTIVPLSKLPFMQGQVPLSDEKSFSNIKLLEISMEEKNSLHYFA